MLYYLIISIYRHYLIQQGGGGFAAPAALLSDLCFSTAPCRSCGRRPAERRCRSIRRFPRLGRCSPTGFFVMILQLFCPLCNAPRPFLVQHFLPPLRFLFSLHGFSVQFARKPVIIYNLYNFETGYLLFFSRRYDRIDADMTEFDRAGISKEIPCDNVNTISEVSPDGRTNAANS